MHFISFALVIAIVSAVFVAIRSMARVPVDYRSLSLALLLFLGLISLFSGLLPVSLGPVLHFALTLGLGTLAAVFFIRILSLPPLPQGTRGQLLWLFGLSLLAIGDGFIIFFKQGWHLASAGPYFRPPFNHDFARNVGLIATLLRGGENPFLPGSLLNYQVFWHQGAASFVGVFQKMWNPLTLYELSAGVTLAYGFFFYFALLSLLATLRPKMIFRVIPSLSLVVLLSTHAEIFNMGFSYLSSGHWGIEADWSAVQPLYFRFVSLKLFSLVAPQHLFSLIYGAFYLICDELLSGVAQKKILAWRFCFLCFAVLSSPLLACLALGCQVLLSLKKGDFKSLVADLLVFAISGLFYHLYFQLSPFELFNTQRTESLVFFGNNIVLWKWLPFELIAGCGVLGIVGIIFGLQSLFGKAKTAESLTWLGGLIVMLTLVNHGWTNPELRRHVTIFICVMVPILLARLVPLTGVSNVIFVASAFLALPLHGYFLYAYLGKPNVLPIEIAWKDYFEMNRVIREKYADAGVISAIDAGQGMVMPVTLEAGVSWAGAPSAVVHGKLNPQQTAALEESLALGSVLPRARSLGYSYLMWGPFEELVWPRAVRERFVSPENKVAEKGSVSLYHLRDKLLDSAGQDPAVKAEKLRAGGWVQEAAQEYRKVIKREPTNWKAHHRLGLCEKILEDFPSSLRSLSEALRMKSTNAEILFTRGVVYSHMGRWYDALNDFERVKELSPGFMGIDHNLRIAKARNNQ